MRILNSLKRQFVVKNPVGRPTPEFSNLQLELESGVTIPSPSDVDFARIAGEEFAILSGADADTYIQCAEMTEPPWEYILEYQDGSIDKHYRAIGGTIKLDQIIVAFRKYRNGDASWLTDLEWERMDLT